MGTVHEDAADAGLEDLLVRGGGHLLPQLKDALDAGAFPIGFRRAFGDWAWRGRTYAQMYAFMRIDGLMRHRHAALIRINVGAAPGRDRDRESNAAALANLPYPFTAHLDMTQNNADQDGWLALDQPIGVKLYPSPAETDDGLAISPIHMPLEVGSSAPSKLWMHLALHGAVARWPYGEEDLYVLMGAPSPCSLRGASAKVTSSTPSASAPPSSRR